jgi:hypothetical protein
MKQPCRIPLITLGFFLAAQSVSLGYDRGGGLCDICPGCGARQEDLSGCERAMESNSLGLSDSESTDVLRGEDFGPDSFFGNVNLAAGASGSRGEFGGFGHNSIGDFLTLGGTDVVIVATATPYQSEIPRGKRIKAVDNNSPLPQDRVFFNYNYYHKAFHADFGRIGRSDVSLDNYTFGIEKTFLDGLFSVDLRIPLHSRVSHNFGNTFLNQQNNMGDVYLAAKVLLRDWEHGALCSGTGMAFPTGSDITASEFQIKHRSFHLTPFLGYIASPIDRMYFTFWGQLDFDCTGDRYIANSGTRTGVVQDTAAGYASASIAWFFFENRCHWLQSVSGICEFHYSGTIKNQDAFDIGSIASEPVGSLSLLNLTAGFQYRLANGLDGRVAAVAPLTTGREALFPFELVVQTDFKF